MNQPGPTGQVRRNREIKLDGILVITHATRIRHGSLTLHTQHSHNTDTTQMVDNPALVNLDAAWRHVPRATRGRGGNSERCPEPCIVLIDDAHLVADDSQVLARVLALPDSPLLFIVAGRNNDLRTLYSHWTGQIRKSRLGVLLVPDADYDGDLLGVRLPRHPAATVNKGTLKYSLTYRTIKQPLSGDVLEAVTSARSCPDATWDDTAKVVPHSPALTSIDAKCGWTITLKTLPQEEPVTVTAKFPATEAAISNQSNLQTWLQNQQQATDKALNNDAVTSTAYSLQRLQTMRIKIPPASQGRIRDPGDDPGHLAGRRERDDADLHHAFQLKSDEHPHRHHRR